jgi:hypothetical protein
MKMMIPVTLMINNTSVVIQCDLVLPEKYQNNSLIVENSLILRQNNDISSPIHGVDNVYLIQCGNSTYYKIGHSNYPLERLTNLQVGSPHNLKLIACCPGGKTIEDYLHNVYNSNKVRGEWFNFNEEELKSFIDVMKGIRNDSHTDDENRVIDDTKKENKTEDLQPTINLLNILSSKLITNSIEDNQDKLLHNNTEDEIIKCLRSCGFCKEKWDENDLTGIDNETFGRCLNICVNCNRKRKNAREELKDKLHSLTIHAHESSQNLDIIQISGQQVAVGHEDIVGSDDKYFIVTLTAIKEDGDEKYITDSLIKNFKQMFPPSYRAVSWAYSISKNNDVPYLYGMIRYDHNNKYRLTPKSTHIRNRILSQHTGKRNDRDYNVVNITKYNQKHYKTKIRDIVSHYENIAKKGQVVGNALERFIQNDNVKT